MSCLVVRFEEVCRLAALDGGIPGLRETQFYLAPKGNGSFLSQEFGCYHADTAVAFRLFLALFSLHFNESCRGFIQIHIVKLQRIFPVYRDVEGISEVIKWRSVFNDVG